MDLANNVEFPLFHNLNYISIHEIGGISGGREAIEMQGDENKAGGVRSLVLSR
jgi:hypothetical protein